MKMVGLLCAGAVAFGAINLTAGPAAAASNDAGSAPATYSFKSVKHKHHKMHGRIYREESADAARRAYYRSLEPYRSMDFKGGFPGNCAVLRAAGECMIDLGYGRCESCNTGGGPP